LEQVKQDPDFVALSRQFKTTAMELVSVLEQVTSESKRLSVLVPPFSSFVFASALEFLR
jgi:ATP-dependent Lon protease